ncbi:MAG: hypothetical protein JW821_14010 [Deltaproteobacteria bacterium]|nr:hypothetical protein [Deltaproteobacteria bacterium]
MISINATLVIQIIQFLILVFILNRIMFRPLLKIVRQRSEFIRKTKVEIANIEEETERLRKEFLTLQDKARADATKERTRLRAAGITESESSMKQSQKKVAAIRTEAQNKAEEEYRKTQPSLPPEASALADEIAERVIGRRITV